MRRDDLRANQPLPFHRHRLAALVPLLHRQLPLMPEKNPLLLDRHVTLHRLELLPQREGRCRARVQDPAHELA